MASTNNNKPGTVHQVKFVGHDAAGLPVKRKQVHQACGPCRKRKKRCEHLLHATTRQKELDSSASSSEERQTQSSASSQGEGIVPDRDASDAAAQLLRFFHHVLDKESVNSLDNNETPKQPQQVEPAPPFFGDTNPEGILVEATLAPTARPKTSGTDDNGVDHMIGVLSPTSPFQSMVPPTRDQDAVSMDKHKPAEEVPGPFFSVPRRDGSRFTIHVQDTEKFIALTQTLVNRGLADRVMPSDREWRAMRDLYLAKIHPIFPVFEKSTLVDLPADKELAELIKASVCLAAASDPEACSLLTFKRTAAQSQPENVPESRIAVAFDEYSQEVANFINRRLTELQERQQLPLVHGLRVMAITCYYWQPAHPSERFEPLSLFARLVGLAHTHGIHLGTLERIHADGQPDAGSSGSRLFKCLYALDRLLSAYGGRPIMFHNYDIKMPHPDQQDPPSFRLFMSLILLLDQVIELYRPNPTVRYIDVPVFERLALESGAQNEPEGILATLEVLYHAICVLSVRMPRHRFRTAPECDTVPCASYQHLPPSGVNARRSHSSDRILDVIRDYKLSPMPFVPYALTLSLSVAYRKWRFSRLPMFRTRGGADFKKVLRVLQDMGKIWSSARLNAQLGQAVMMKLEQNEALLRKRTDKAGDGARVADGERRAEDHNDNNRDSPTEVQNGGSNGGSATVLPPGNAKDDPQPPMTPSTAPHAPSASSVPVRSTQRKGTENTDSNGFLGPPPSLRGSIPSPAISSGDERAHSVAPASQPPWTNIPPAVGSTSIPNNSITWTFHQREQISGPKDHAPRPNLAERSRISSPYDYNASDAVPLPGDLVYPPNELDGLLSVAGVSERGLNDFVDDDDALFRSWDPRFAQSVDFSFSSNLDPGNPFAWPEYCNYTA
ncbi:hypothetical protein VTK56DRAFT_3575 [Thermocarpiscus australiensis]